MPDEGLFSRTIDRTQHTVLVVDDNTLSSQATAQLLRMAGFQVMEVGTSAGALAAASPETAAVVVDLKLSGTEGLELCREFRTLPDIGQLPLVHVSAGSPRKEGLVVGLKSGADAYLVHPVEPPALIATLQALIRARAAEEAMRRSEARFRAVYTNAHSGIALIDEQGRFADANPALEKLLGRTRDGMLGKAISDFAPPDMLDDVQNKMQKAVEEGANLEHEFPLLTGDGRLVYLNWHSSPHVAPDLRIGIVIDVTERTLLDERSQELLAWEDVARRTAKQHSQARDKFASVLSHELRTPLNTIQNWVDVLRHHGGLPPDVAKGLDVIDRSVQEQVRLVSNILDVFPPDFGSLMRERSWANPAQLVAYCVASQQASADEKQVAIQQATGEAQRAWMNVPCFEKICRNLVSNAIKFSSQGGTVSVVLQHRGDMLRLSVRDRGAGTDPALIDDVFKHPGPAGALSSSHPDRRGGDLPMVKHLAELHGGTAKAYSAGLDQGTTMMVEINVTPPPISAEGIGFSGLNGKARPKESQVLEGMDILIVEDNADALEVLGMMLLQHSAVVRMAWDHDSALAEIAEVWPDILVCDIGLPGKDGYQIVRQVRQWEQSDARPRLPCIALTAFARPGDRARAIEAGFDMHIAKPPRAGEVLSAVIELTRGKPRAPS